MTDKKQNMTQHQLETLIKRYFEAELSNAEELQLRNILATTGYSSPVIDEARFTMGFMSVGMAQHQQNKSRHHKTIRRVAIAASAAVLVVVGAALFHATILSSNNDCVAYVNGQKVSDEAQVMALIKNDVSNIDDASAEIDNSMEAQLSNFGAAIEIDKN